MGTLQVAQRVKYGRSETIIYLCFENLDENVVKKKKGIATSLPSISFTSKNVVEEEEVIATRPSISKNEVKASRSMTNEVEVTSEPSNLPLQLKYLYKLIIDLKNVSKYVFVDSSLISASHSTREIRARNLCSRLMTSEQDQLAVASYNLGDHWSLVVINPYDDVVYHLDSLRSSSRDDIKYVTNMALTIFQSQKNLKKTRKTTFWKAVKCPLQVGTDGYYVMRYMRKIIRTVTTQLFRTKLRSLPNTKTRPFNVKFKTDQIRFIKTV
uniref:Ubiquitin-like protease family profile domain-containing protein n=1 Tax=Cucumis melo TaxID=3656 RepID=A0A9I9E865_CUCME